MLEVMFWFAVGTAAFVIIGVFVIMTMLALCGVLGVFGSVVAALAWVMERIANLLPEPSEKKDRQGID